MPRLDGNGASLYFETDGDASAPALLLLHAGIANLRMWDPQIDALKQRHYVIRYDARGFGETTTENVEFSARTDALRLLDHLGVDKATVIGCSRGGQIALDLAVESPSRVAGLVAIGAGPSGFPELEPTVEEEAIIDEMDLAFETADWEKLNRLEVKLWSIGPLRDEADLDQQFVRTAYELNHANLAHIDESPTQLPLEPPSYDRVVDIAVPVLVMVGDHDVSESLAQSEYLLSVVPRADGARFPGSAHLPSVEQPGDFTRVLLRWLDEHGL
jgi:3-oxoadipate enol-lactonase